MLMAVDIGNTQTVLGLFDGEETRGQWRVATEAHRTADELAVVYAALLEMRGLRRGEVDAMIVSSVVPALDPFVQGPRARSSSTCRSTA